MVIKVLILMMLMTEVSTKTVGKDSLSFCCTENSLEGYAIKGNVLKVYRSKSMDRCILLCQRIPHCASINYRRDEESCDLNKFRSEESPGEITYEANSVFIKNVLNQYGCTWSCKNGGIYVYDFTGVDGYCKCRYGYRGFACEECVGYALGIENGAIRDSQMKSPTFSRPPHAPSRARLNLRRFGGWIPLEQNRKQYLYIEFLAVTEVTSIATQGCGRKIGPPCWTSKYLVSYQFEWLQSLWTYYKEKTGVNRVFEGNSNYRDIKINVFSRHMIARRVAIHPMAWKNCICLRIEMYGCYKK